MIRLFDTHCHLDEACFENDLPAVFADMEANGIAAYAVMGTNLESSRRGLAFADTHEGAYAAVGFHPEEADTFQDRDISSLAELLEHPRVVAVGEIGLDYHWPDGCDREQQKRVLDAQLDLAWEHSKPACFHVRDAHGDMLELLRNRNKRLPRGVMHCYSGSWESARSYLDLGMYLAFGGTVTFRNARKAQEVAMKVPLDRLLLETDSPYLSPEPFRGSRNDPSRVRLVAERVAELRGMPVEELAEITYRNARVFFGIS